MFARLICSPVLALLVPSLCAAQTEREALDSLRAANPGIRWEAHATRLDFDCDSAIDYAFLGRASRHIYVAVFLTRTRKVTGLQFGISAGVQAAICAEPASLTAESLDFDPSTSEEIGPLEGFRRSASCKGLELSGGECDPIHLYWNHTQGRMSWWRL